MKKICKTFIAGIGLITLSGCGNSFEFSDDNNKQIDDNSQTEKQQNEHEHTFSSDWNFDKSSHWHEATCEHKDQVKDRGNHIDANNDNYCDICGYKTVEENSELTEEDKNLYSDYLARKQLYKSADVAEELVENGAVLLKNDNNCLPLNANERRITIFGQGSYSAFMRSNVYGPNPCDMDIEYLDIAFAKNGFSINQEVAMCYDIKDATNSLRPDTNIESASKVCSNGVLKSNVLASCNEYKDAAIVTLTRVGGENQDFRKESLELYSDERTLLKAINQSGLFEKTIVLINSPSPISTDWVDEYGVDAIIYMGSAGYYGAEGIAHLIAGEKTNENGEKVKVSPSGRLTNSFATSPDSSPAFQNYGDSNVAVYKEGIYVGYKYYETRYEDLVLSHYNAMSDAGIFDSTGNHWNYADEMGYPFGYGLSYTTFNQRILDLSYNQSRDEYDVKVEVENTGNIGGKEAVQVYVQVPYTHFDEVNEIEKASIQLVGYDKVSVEAGKKVETTISIPTYLLTTYDSKVNKTYILEGGTYYFALGNGAHEALNNVIASKDSTANLYDQFGNDYEGKTNAVKSVRINEDLNTYSKSIYNSKTEVTNQFDDADYNYYAMKNSKDTIQYLSRQDWKATWPTKTTISPATNDDLNMNGRNVDNNQGTYASLSGKEYEVTYKDSKGNKSVITYDDMVGVPLEGVVESGKFAGQNGADIWDAFIKQMSLDDLIVSISDNRGISSIESIEKPGSLYAEGVEGILEKYNDGGRNNASSYPSASITAGTFDHALQTKLGDCLGQEAELCGVDILGALCGTINRTPYFGRTNETTGEDPILAYYAVSNISLGAKKYNVVMNVGSCVLNNQEIGRQGLQTYCDEQTIREVYLKPFEGTLTRGQCMNVRTSYNRIGAVYSACNKNLQNNIFRNEWNFKGMIGCDALTGSNTSSYSNGPAMLSSGTDYFMLDYARGAQLKDYIESTNDINLLKSLQRANKDIFYSLLTSQNNKREYDLELLNEAKQYKNSIFTDDVVAKINEYKNTFDPRSVLIKEKNSYDYNSATLTNITNYTERSDVNLVYTFTGGQVEGWQGDYSITKGNIYLWSDGIFTGKIGDRNIKGYWYNSSLNGGKDNKGNDIKDCIVLVSNISKYEYMRADFVEGNTDSILNAKLIFYWGERQISLSGNYYYPIVAIKVISTLGKTTYKVGETFNFYDFDVVAINSNFEYYSIRNSESSISWNGPASLMETVYTVRTFAKTGTLQINGRYNSFTDSLVIQIVN